METLSRMPYKRARAQDGTHPNPSALQDNTGAVMEGPERMPSAVDYLRADLHSHARDAELARSAEPESVVTEMLKAYLGDIEVPRIVLDHFVDEYVAAVSAAQAAYSSFSTTA